MKISDGFRNIYSSVLEAILNPECDKYREGDWKITMENESLVKDQSLKAKDGIKAL